jgi:light-regulated signal transduction histidine kinase (bacteriophytochrome)
MMPRPPDPPGFGEATVANCDREPIHIPGSIQPHGVLLVVDPRSLEVLQAAGDPALIGAAGPLAGRAVADLLPPAAMRRILAAPGPHGESLGHAIEATLPDGRAIDLVLHRSPAGLLLEIEPREAAGGHAAPLGTVQAMIRCLQPASTLRDACQAAAEEVRRVTGFDRVMVYRFQPDGSGAVIAEARHAAAPSFLDLHYPASDIPRQARALYLRNWVRLIPDARYTPAPLVPPVSPLTGEPTDLSACGLRSVSPLHLAYLANMGVRASMSLSLVRDGALWGLIACHHDTPHHVPAALRSACELFAHMFSLQIAAREQAEDFALADRLQRGHAALVRAMAEEPDLARGLARHRAALLDLIDSEGVALLHDGTLSTIGRVPPEPALRELLAWAAPRAADGVLALEELGAAWPPAASLADCAAGVLVLSISREPRDCLVWFRPELPRRITWAGDPAKPVEITDQGARLSPRRSFDAWQETVRGRSRPWRAIEVDAARALRVALLEVVLRRMEQVAQERARAKERQDLLLAELDHRVKNTLANIRALVQHSSRNAAGLEGFVAELHGRLRAMAATHSLLSHSRWEGAALRGIVQEELAPYRDAGEDRVAIDGPELRLRPKAALALSLALHELLSNAARHGALSLPRGRVSVSWRVEHDRLLLDWHERGGPRVMPPARRGFGCLVIERSLAYETGGRVRLDFAPEGVACHVEMPLRQVAEAGAWAPGTAEPQAGLAALGGASVLVAEDSSLVAMEIETALVAAGAEVIGPHARLPDAMAALGRRLPDAALLDIDLDGALVYPLADALAARGVPLVFTTGYDPQLVLPPRFAAAAVLCKPFRGEEAAAALAALLAPA